MKIGDNFVKGTEEILGRRVKGLTHPVFDFVESTSRQDGMFHLLRGEFLICHPELVSESTKCYFYHIKNKMFNYHTRILYPNLIPEMDKVNSLIKEISAKIVSAIDPKNKDNTIMPKVVWKYRTYVEVSKHRVLDFTISACEEWNRGSVAPAIVLIRCIYENEAYLYDVYSQLKKFIEDNDFNSCDDLIMNRLHGSRIENVNMPQIPNVLTVIDKLNKLIPGFRLHYDHLSEIAHPNYLGMVGLYSKLIKKPYIHTIVGSELAIDEGNFKIVINSLIPSLIMYCDLLKKMEDLYPKLSKLSDEDKVKRTPTVDPESSSG